MGRFDDLPADQQAVLRLLLRDDRSSYEEIARTLRMAPAAVRDRAHDAVGALGPEGSHVPRERRAEIADSRRRQQDDATAARTRAALDASAAERGWARIVTGELRPLAAAGLPEIPGTPAASTSPLLDAPAPDTAAPAGPRSSRRGGAVLLGALGVIAALAIGFFVGRATKDGGSSKDSASSGTTAGQATTKVDGQANLVAPANSIAPKSKGIAQFVTSQGQKGVVVRAQGLPKIPDNAGYPVWLTGTGQSPVLLGFVQGVDASGNAQAIGQIQVDPRKYEQVLVTRSATKQPSKPGTVVMAGPITFAAS